jgi:hypothetical protein
MPLLRCQVLRQIDGKFAYLPLTRNAIEAEEQVGAVQVGLTLGQAMTQATLDATALAGILREIRITVRSI